MRQFLFVSLLVLVVWVFAVHSQAPIQTALSPTASSATEPVAIYITAATKKGVVPLTDLKTGDLTIREGKAEAKVEKISCGRPDPILLGVLVDVSGSRRDARLASQYDALQVFLNEVLMEHDTAFVLAYDNQLYKLSDLTADRASLSAAFDKLKKHQPYGSTALYDAIQAAANANFFGRGGHRILVVVGDWEDNSSHISLEQVTEVPERTLTTVYAIVDSKFSTAMSQRSHEHALAAAKHVTESSGGLYYDVRSEKDFAAAVQAIQAAISGSCRVDYSIPKVVDAQKGIKLHVEAKSQETSIHYPRVRFAQ
jgi:VWFA-related protein